VARSALAGLDSRAGVGGRSSIYILLSIGLALLFGIIISSIID
jgi:hypothetical protein